jgi:hypothetical protein
VEIFCFVCLQTTANSRRGCIRVVVFLSCFQPSSGGWRAAALLLQRHAATLHQPSPIYTRLIFIFCGWLLGLYRRRNQATAGGAAARSASSIYKQKEKATSSTQRASCSSTQRLEAGVTARKFLLLLLLQYFFLIGSARYDHCCLTVVASA